MTDITVILPYTARDALFDAARQSIDRAASGVPDLAVEVLEIDDSARTGVSRARNRGLADAQGEWVVFVDADDLLAENFFSDIFVPLRERADIDLIVAGFETIDAEESGTVTAAVPGEGEAKPDATVMSGLLYMENRILARDTHVWGKAFRRTALEGHTFDEDLTIGEDMLFLADLALAVGKRRAIAVTETPGYLYRLSPAGAMLGTYRASFLDELACWEKLRDRLLPVANRFTPYAFSALGAIRIRSGLLIGHKISALPPEKWEDPEVQAAIRRAQEAIRDARGTNGAFGALSLKEKFKTLLFMRNPRRFLTLARRG